MQLKPIEVILTPYKEQGRPPVRGGSVGHIRDRGFPEFAEGLKGIDKHLHLIVLYWCDRGTRDQFLTTTPGMTAWGGVCHPLPHRPNPIAFDLVDLISGEGNRLW